ncbi:MAG: glycoside hydrolase family 36 protein [Lentisphaeria bacterium]
MTFFPSLHDGATEFGHADQHAWLKQLFGLACGANGHEEGFANARGLALVDTDRGRFEGDALPLAAAEFRSDAVRLAWEVPGILRLESRWTLDAAAGLWSRQDALHNLGSVPLTLFKCLARFTFAPGHYELYSQGSRWCNENQGLWQALPHGTLEFGNGQGRSTQGGTPYLCLRERDGRTGVAFHLLPEGNWTIRVRAANCGNDLLPPAVVELGQRIENLKLKLAPGAALRLPEILVQAVPEGVPELAAPRLHRYLLDRSFATAKPHAPVVYNSWFDFFDVLNDMRLRQQLAAAKEIGCEVLVIDAGWYGQGEGDWGGQTGDWREKLTGAFAGRMREFADEVRAAGLGFGLWMEPERLCPGVPAVLEHPEWFIRGPQAFYPDLRLPAARAWVLAEIGRLVADYGLVWMKIDFNHHLGEDASGAEFLDYYRAWYELLDVIRARHPQVFFEGCSSGAMRLDAKSLQHFDGHFLSDTVNPVEVIRIHQGEMLRAVPGRITKWTTLRNVGPTLPEYGHSPDNPPASAVTANWATWEITEKVNVNFAARVCMSGMLGFSGDLAGLAPEMRARLAANVAFFKPHRDLIARAVCHLLTPPRPKEDRTGWAAFQFQDPADASSLLFIHRLDDQCQTRRFFPRDLEPAAAYAASTIDAPEATVRTGAEWMRDGVTATLPGRFQASVVELRRQA